MLIRRAGVDDLPALQSCFFASVSVLAAPYYNAEQRRAWVELVLAQTTIWRNKLADNLVWQAVVDGQVLGFCSLTPQGLIDWLYVHPSHARRGVASALLEQAETMARYEGMPKLEVFASLAAQPLFIARGFTLAYRQELDVNGVALENAHMVKPLAA